MSKVKYIKFESSNCMGCTKLTNALLTLGRLEEVQSFNIETDEGWDMAEKYGVRSVPVMIKLENDKETQRMVGFSLVEFRAIMGDL